MPRQRREIVLRSNHVSDREGAGDRTQDLLVVAHVIVRDNDEFVRGAAQTAEHAGHFTVAKSTQRLIGRNVKKPDASPSTLVRGEHVCARAVDHDQFHARRQP